MKNNYIPQKIGIFVWRTLRGRIPVRVELDRRGIDLDSILCPMCNDYIETVEHAIISCKVAKDIWKAIYNWWGSNPPDNASLSNHFSGSGRDNLPGGNKKIWQAVEWVSGYFIWKKRNQKIFRNDSWASSKVVSEIQVKTFEWITNRSRRKSLEWIQWLTNPINLGSPRTNNREPG
ncbi:uncharacterized protein [Rutidosis leptorrhynchoides]|uniref:uncharacterized protein n=1 Tax=Rutidosis leptorrhynchoides TaxID=125765 RepID=UPI003A99CCF6